METIGIKNETGDIKVKVANELFNVDLWANGHFPQIWSAKSIMFAEVFLRNNLEHKITLAEFKDLRNADLEMSNLLIKANNAHEQYSIKGIDLETYKTTFGRSLDEAVSVMGSVVPLDYFDDASKMNDIQSLFNVFSNLVKYLRSSESIRLSGEYRETLRNLPQRNNMVMPINEQIELERSWVTFSEKLVKGMLEVIKRREGIEDNFNPTISLFEAYLKNASKVVFIQSLSKHHIIPG